MGVATQAHHLSLLQSTRATLTQYSGSDVMPPIRITVVENSSDVLIRVSDQGQIFYIRLMHILTS
jgi:hypothetical protein